MRAIWSGSISFGLVTVPVQMYSATESKELRFHFLHKDDLQPIGYDKVRKDTGEHVDTDDVVRGFEIEKGKYVPIEDEDLDRLDIELTHSIDILDFVDLGEIDPIYFRKAYYLAPQDGAEKPYRLLVRALDETGKVGIAKVVIRNKQHLAALRAHDHVALDRPAELAELGLEPVAGLLVDELDLAMRQTRGSENAVGLLGQLLGGDRAEVAVGEQVVATPDAREVRVQVRDAVA